MTGSEKIRVCMISPGAASHFFPDLPATHGGSETQLYLQSRELARQDGFDVHVIVHGEQESSFDRREGVRVHFTPIVPGIKAKWQLQRLMRRIDADVYLQRGIGSLAKEIAFFNLWRRRKFLYWVAADYDVAPDRRPSENDNELLGRNKWFVWGMLRANVIVAQTKFQQERLRRDFGRESEVIRNGFPARQPATGEREFVLWVGRFAPLKQPELFVELASRLPEERFVLIGPAHKEDAVKHLARWQDRMEQLPNLEYVSGVPFAEIDGYYDRAKLVVNTTLFEGFPNTFVQAMWSGTPLASLHCDPDRIIAENDLGVAPTGEIASFAEKVGALLCDRERLEQCAARAHRYAVERHDVSRNVIRLAQCLRELTDRS